MTARVVLEPTIALAAGEGRVEQCAWCGALVCTTGIANPRKLGPCPACGNAHWWRQTFPVGSFIVDDEGGAP